MAKKKNIVKSSPNSLRQALLPTKTALLNFSPEHILTIDYDPASKVTTVKDIPANLESQFTLGEGGGVNLEPLSITITYNDDTGEYSANKSYQNFKQEWVDALDNLNFEYNTDISKLNYPCTVTVIETFNGEPYSNNTYDGAIISSGSQNSNDGSALFIATYFGTTALKNNNDEYYMCIYTHGMLFYQHQADDVIEGHR